MRQSHLGHKYISVPCIQTTSSARAHAHKHTQMNPSNDSCRKSKWPYLTRQETCMISEIERWDTFCMMGMSLTVTEIIWYDNPCGSCLVCKSTLLWDLVNICSLPFLFVISHWRFCTSWFAMTTMKKQHQLHRLRLIRLRLCSRARFINNCWPKWQISEGHSWFSILVTFDLFFPSTWVGQNLDQKKKYGLKTKSSLYDTRFIFLNNHLQSFCIIFYIMLGKK